MGGSEDYHDRLETLYCKTVEETGVVPHVKIDVNIDPVQIFENTTSGSAIPIQARVHSIGKFKIPVRQSLPLLIGFYHGPGMCGRCAKYTAVSNASEDCGAH